MKSLAFIVKPILNVVAWVLKLSRHNIYYLVSGPLKKEIQEESKTAFAYQHIENAINIARQQFRNTGNTIIDVGGGTATTATIFAKHFPQHILFIFEPIKESFNIINQAPSKTSNWRVINKAAGNNIGKTIINIAQRTTASSLLDMQLDSDGYYGDILKSDKKEEIEITTLDHEIPNSSKVDILKLDVQGFELEVLKGAEDILKNTKVVVLEINNHAGFKGAPTYYDIDTFFRERNFELYDILPSHRENNKLMDWDAIYINSSLKQ